MKKDNIYRFIFWSFILIISAVLGTIGYIKSTKEFNQNKTKIVNIINIFNSHSTIKRFNGIDTNLKATINNRTIVVNYNDIKKYTFKIYDDYLQVKVNKNDSDAKMIVMIIADSIAVYNGEEEKSTFDYFNNNFVFNMKLDQGIEYKSKYKNYIIKINLNKYIKSDI